MDMLKGRGARKHPLPVPPGGTEGIRRFRDAHPDIPIYTASIDEGAQREGLYHPGLGDAGDRMYGTK